MVDVTTQIIIQQPVKKVSEYSGNPENAPKWYVNIKSARWERPKKLEQGTKVQFEAEFMGKVLRYTYEIMEYLPEQKLTMSTAQGPFPMTTVYEWEHLEPHSTRMTLRNYGQPSGFSRWMAPFMKWMIRKANKKDLSRLKILLENNKESE